VTVDIPSFYLSHREEIDQAAKNQENPLLALYMRIFRDEALRMLKEVMSP